MGLLIKDNDYVYEALGLVREAKHSIYVSTFKAENSLKPAGTELHKLFSAIILKAKQGIKVKVLLNWNQKRHCVAKTNFSVAQVFKGCGIKVRHLKNNRCCHAKVFIIDKTKALLGSHNLSVKSVTSNFELSYLIPDPETVKQLSSVFEQSFMDAQNF